MKNRLRNYAITIFAVLIVTTFAIAMGSFNSYAADKDAPKKVIFSKMRTGYESILLAWYPVTSSKGKVYYEIRDMYGNVVNYETKRNKNKEHYQTTTHTYAKATGLTVTSVRVPVYKFSDGTLPNYKRYRVYSYIIKNGKKIYSEPAYTGEITLIHPMYVRFEVRSGTKYYSTKYATNSLGKLKTGKYYYAYGGNRTDKVDTFLIYINGKTVYVKVNDVKNLKYYYNSQKYYTNKQVENYINDSGLDSNPVKVNDRPKRMIWISTYCQRVYVLRGSKGNWKVEYSYPANTGGGTDLTPHGFYRISGKWYIKNSTGTKYWCIFNGVAVHGPYGRFSPGKPVSGGCVRVALNNAKWMYDNISKKTTVYVY